MTTAQPVETTDRHEDSEGTDLERVQRIGARFLGAGFVAYLLVSTGEIRAQSVLTAPWWPPLSVLAAIGPAVVLIVASFRPGTKWLSPLAMMLSAGYLVATATWFLAWTGDTLGDTGRSAVWLIGFPALPAMVLMLVHPRWSLIHTAVATVGINIAQQCGRFGHPTPELGLELLWACSFSGVFLAIAFTAVRTARLLDRTRADAYAGAAATAAVAAAEAEQSRFDALIHDRVIATLLAVTPGRSDDRLALQASTALTELDRLSHGSGPVVGVDDTVPTTVALQRIRVAVADVRESAEIDIVNGALAGSTLPAQVVSALVEATQEALRNVARHAGPDANCAVICRTGDDAITIAIVDDGVGFDPDAVPAGRLGIAAGISRRMKRIHGGSATVRSEPGRGTTVGLRWEQP